MKKFISWLKGFKFVNWRKKHDKLRDATVELLQERDEKYEAMHSYMRTCINRLESELSKERAKSGQFNQDELRSLVQLVHPDKHGGKEVAVGRDDSNTQLEVEFKGFREAWDGVKGQSLQVWLEDHKIFEDSTDITSAGFECVKFEEPEQEEQPKLMYAVEGV